MEGRGEREPARSRVRADDEAVHSAYSAHPVTGHDEPASDAVVATELERMSAPTGLTADEELVRELYAEHAGPLLGYVLRLINGDRQRAEDVVQETFFRAWRRPDSLDPARGSIRAWLATVARNIVIDGERARQARPVEVGEAALDALSAGDQEIDRALVAYDVAAVLAELAPHHREVLVEVYYRGYSVAEAAERLGVPPGTVKSRTYYALRQLKLLLEERGVSAAEVH